nr:hypothetical protein [Mucilaginibacter sp. X5P1]
MSNHPPRLLLLKYLRNHNMTEVLNLLTKSGY